MDSCSVTIYRNILDTTISTMSCFNISYQSRFFCLCWIAQVINCWFFSWIEICIFNCKTCMADNKCLRARCVICSIDSINLTSQSLIRCPNNIFSHRYSRCSRIRSCFRCIRHRISEGTTCTSSPSRKIKQVIFPTYFITKCDRLNFSTVICNGGFDTKFIA